MTAIVELIGSPENLAKIIYTAYRTCYSSEGAGKIWEELQELDKPLPTCKQWVQRTGFCYPKDSLQEGLDSSVCNFLVADCQNSDTIDYRAPLKSLYGGGAEQAKKDCQEIKDLFLQKKQANKKMLDLILNYGDTHSSPLGHAMFTFTLDNVSRACTHQIVRNQIGAVYSQKSQRYVTEKGQFFGHITPDKIRYAHELFEGLSGDYRHDNNLHKKYIDFMENCHYLYAEMIRAGIPAEDARYILPNAATSSMEISYTLRALIHLANLRLCTKAQWEYRGIVKEMCKQVIEKEPFLAKFLQPKCYKLGHCDEKKGCGMFPAKVEHGRNYWESE